MLLSIGLIVKNEEKYLDECLNALQPLMKAIDSELVIVDTGSTDRTVEIAKKYTDKVYFFEWINDFAAARNFGLDRCVGKWFMFLDADEVLLDSSELIDFFETGKYKQYKFAKYIIRNFKDLEKDIYNDGIAIRLGENKNLRFGGRIHETFINKPQNLNVYTMNKTIFKHYGYLDEVYINKIKRNDTYVQSIIENEEFDSRIYNYRILHLIALGEYNKAIEIAECSIPKFNQNNIHAENYMIFNTINAYLCVDEYLKANNLYHLLFEQKLNVVDVYFSSFRLIQYCLENDKYEHLCEYVINLLNAYENYKWTWEKYREQYNYNEKVLLFENLNILFKQIIKKLSENNLTKDMVYILDLLYKFKGFNCWCFKEDVEMMKKQKDYSRVKNIYLLVKDTDKEIDFLLDILFLKNNNREIYEKILIILCELPSANIMLKVLEGEDVPLKIIAKSSDVMKSAYFSNKLQNKQVIKNTKKILDTKVINNVIGLLLHFDSSFTNTVYEYLLSIDEDFESQSDILFMMQLIYYAIAQHSINDNDKLLVLFLNLIEFTYEYVSKSGDIQSEELSKFLLAYNCKLALICAENGDLKSAIIFVKEGLQFGKECAYVVASFLNYLQNM